MIKINQIFIEQDLLQHQKALSILDHFQDVERKVISRYDDIFGKVKKPYLQKRQGFNLFIAQKKGTLIKEAPEAYGAGSGKHFYFIHAYNCIYECEYCYLQGYFHSPDLVLFVNHEDIVEEMSALSKQYSNEEIWFHAGEFSDSLALSHMTKELDIYFEFFTKNPQLILELRTKSDNIQSLLEQTPAKNIITSFSLSPKKNLDYKAPSLDQRLNAIELLYKRGFPIGIHLDPIIPVNNYEDAYEELIISLKQVIPLEDIYYFSLGVTRFPEKIYHQVLKNYPESTIFKEQLLKDKKGIVRAPRPIRFPMMETIQNFLLDHGAKASQVYLCME